jgi:uncharacterized membrane protein
MNWLQFFVAALELPPDPRQRQFWARLAHLQLIYSLAGLIVGLTCVVGGLGLFLHGIVGSSSWVGDFIGIQSKLADAAPGTVLFIVGLLVIWLTRFSVRVRQPINIEVGGQVGKPSREIDKERKRKAS